MKASLQFDAHNSPYADLSSSPPIWHPAFLPTGSFSSLIIPKSGLPCTPQTACLGTMWGMKAIWGENHPDFVVPSVGPASLAPRLRTPPPSTARSPPCCRTQPHVPPHGTRGASAAKVCHGPRRRVIISPSGGHIGAVLRRTCFSGFTSRSQAKCRATDNTGKNVRRSRPRPQIPHPPRKYSELGRLEKKRFSA